MFVNLIFSVQCSDFHQIFSLRFTGFLGESRTQRARRTKSNRSKKPPPRILVAYIGIRWRVYRLLKELIYLCVAARRLGISVMQAAPPVVARFEFPGSLRCCTLTLGNDEPT